MPAAAGPRELPKDRIPSLRVVPMPADTNHNGDIFGGWIMSQVDIAGGIVAGRVARGRVATVVRIGKTSITVDVEVYAERGREDTKVVKVTEAVLTFVAIDQHGRPRPVPKPAA